MNPQELIYFGAFLAPVANEPDCAVRTEIFRLQTGAVAKPAAEIGEVVWIDPSAPGNINLAPLARDRVLKWHKSKPQQ